MSHFDAKILDSDSDGMALLAAVLHTVPGTNAASVHDCQRVARPGSFAKAFASQSRTNRPAGRTVKLA